MEQPMEQRIDVFSHILPKRYEEERWKRAEKTHFVDHSPSHLKYVRGGKSPIANYQVLIDLDTRFRMMEEFGGYRQVLSVASPPVEAVDPDKSDYLAKVLNDELAFLAEVDDVTSLTKAMMQAASDPTLRRRKAALALQRYQARYSREAVVPQIIDLYKRVIGANLSNSTR